MVCSRCVAHPLYASEYQGMCVPQQDSAHSPDLKYLCLGLSFIGNIWGYICSWDSWWCPPFWWSFQAGFGTLFWLRCWCAVHDQLGISGNTHIPSHLNLGIHKVKICPLLVPVNRWAGGGRAPTTSLSGSQGSDQPKSSVKPQGQCSRRLKWVWEHPG